MKSILITGGCGFVGSHACIEFLKRDYFVHIIDSNINSSENVIKKIKKTLVFEEKKELTKNINFVKGDVRDKLLLEEVFQNAKRDKKEISSVVHFAGLKSVEESINFPLKYWDSNLCSTISLIKVMEKYSCHCLIFSSSATIYELSENIISEDVRISPINPYGNTKAAIENLLNDLLHGLSSNWKIANLRYFNPIGAHTSGFIGESPKGRPSNIFPLILKVANRELSKIKIFGNNWSTKDGTGVRDYIHIMDLAEGHMRALDYLQNNDSGIINLNLGTGKGVSVLELIRKFEEVNKVEIPYVFEDKRKGDFGMVIADNSLAKELLNWYPSKSVEDMCRDGWRWMKMEK